MLERIQNTWLVEIGWLVFWELNPIDNNKLYQPHAHILVAADNALVCSCSKIMPLSRTSL